jgi:hypothetical protein
VAVGVVEHHGDAVAHRGDQGIGGAQVDAHRQAMLVRRGGQPGSEICRRAMVVSGKRRGGVAEQGHHLLDLLVASPISSSNLSMKRTLRRYRRPGVVHAVRPADGQLACKPGRARAASAPATPGPPCRGSPARPAGPRAIPSAASGSRPASTYSWRPWHRRHSLQQIAGALKWLFQGLVGLVDPGGPLHGEALLGSPAWAKRSGWISAWMSR